MGIFTKNKNGKSKGKKKEKSPSRKKGSKANKSKKKTKKRQQSDSSSSSSDSDKKNKGVPANQNEVNMVNQKFNMAGAVQTKPKNPVDFPKKLMQSEYKQMFAGNNNLSNEECLLLDDYLKKKAELRSSDLLVVSEKLVDDEKKSSRLKIVTKYDEGRFGAIYVVQREAAVDDNVVANSPFMIMKTALRNLSSPEVCARLNREIRCLTAFASNEPGRRIPTLLLEGRVLGVPFFVMPLMDVNLEKCREEMNGFFSIPAAFYIAQEILMALKFIHGRGHIHRDIKPTNIVLNSANRNQWFLIDFGECVQANRSNGQSPPDGYGLPFISRETHETLTGTAKNTFIQDLESWFYVFFDMLKPLPWRELIVLSKVGKTKTKFWDDLDASIPLNEYPAQVLAIAKLLKSEKKLELPYKEVSQLLETGFMTSKEGDWKPDWLDREATAIKNRGLREKFEKEKKEKEANKKDEKKDSGGPGSVPKSMYCAPSSTRSPLPVKPGPKQSETKVAKICDDDAKPSPKPRQNLSVYMDITKQSSMLPVLDKKASTMGNKKKYKT